MSRKSDKYSFLTSLKTHLKYARKIWRSEWQINLRHLRCFPFKWTKQRILLSVPNNLFSWGTSIPVVSKKRSCFAVKCKLWYNHKCRCDKRKLQWEVLVEVVLYDALFPSKICTCWWNFTSSFTKLTRFSNDRFRTRQIRKLWTGKNCTKTWIQNTMLCLFHSVLRWYKKETFWAACLRWKMKLSFFVKSRNWLSVFNDEFCLPSRHFWKK